MTSTSRTVRSAYRTTALVDWLALEVEFARPTQFQWLQRILVDHFGDDKRSYIGTVKPGAGNLATRFILRLNDAHCRDVETIRAALAALDRQYTLVGPILIKALEVSLDFYPNDAAARARLLQVVARLQMSLAAYGRHHRQVGPSTRPDFLDSTRKPNPQHTLYINDRDDPVAWRVYHKVRDRDQDLPHEEHRARVEFTLQGAGLHELGIYTLDDLSERGFANFSHLLHFRRFKPMSELIAGKEPLMVYVLQHGTRHDRNMIALYPFGRHAYYRDSRNGGPRYGGHFKPRKHSTHTESDDELNHLVRDRLRDLSQRFTHKIRT